MVSALSSQGTQRESAADGRGGERWVWIETIEGTGFKSVRQDRWAVPVWICFLLLIVLTWRPRGAIMDAV